VSGGGGGGGERREGGEGVEVVEWLKSQRRGTGHLGERVLCDSQREIDKKFRKKIKIKN
jgi:hypothetical protein